MSDRQEASAAIAASVAAGAVAFELRNTAARRLYVEEIGLTSGAATAGRWAIARASAQGAGGTGMTGLPEDPSAPVGAAGLYGAGFSTAPTVGAATTYLRRANTAASVGAGVIWQWGTDRLIVPASGSLLIVCIAASPATVDLYAVWQE